MIQTIDNYIYKLINQGYNSNWLDFLMVKFSDKYFWIPIYILLFIVIIYFFRKKAIIALLCLALSVIFADRITSGIIKPLVKRERPCHVVALTPRVIDPCNNTGSMPSSHAANHFAISVFLIFLFYKSKKITTYLLLFWAIAVAYSRVYCGVHYPSDVLLGGIIGALLGWLCFTLYKIIERKIKWA